MSLKSTAIASLQSSATLALSLSPTRRSDLVDTPQLNSLPTMALRATSWTSLPATVWILDLTTRWSRSFRGLPHPPRATCQTNTARPSFIQFRHLSRSLLTLSPHTLSPPPHPHPRVLHPPISTHTLIATVLVFCAIETWRPLAYFDDIYGNNQCITKSPNRKNLNTHKNNERKHSDQLRTCQFRTLAHLGKALKCLERPLLSNMGPSEVPPTSAILFGLLEYEYNYPIDLLALHQGTLLRHAADALRALKGCKLVGALHAKCAHQ